MATVKFYLKKSGAIELKFTIDRHNRFALATGEKIEPRYWNKSKQEPKSSYRGHAELTQTLSRLRDSIIQVYRDNKEQPISVLREMAADVVKFGRPGNGKGNTLYPIFWKFIQWVEKEYSANYAKKFKALYNKKTKEKTETGHLFNFNDRQTLRCFDLNTLDAFKDYLYNKGHLDSTVNRYLRLLHTFFAWADARGYRLHETKGKPTYSLLEITDKVNKPIALTMAELQKLESLQITEALIAEKLPPKKHGRRGSHTIQALTYARDYLITESRTGQRISDLKTFDLSQMDGMVWVNHVSKGERRIGRVVRVPFNTTFTAPAYEIIRKYGHQLPKVSEQKLNENIKTVCMLAGIDKEVTVVKWRRNEKIAITQPKYKFLSTHTGRKTFITIGLQFLPPKLVKDLAGISWETLKHYEADSEDQVMIDGLNSIPIMKVANS